MSFAKGFLERVLDVHGDNYHRWITMLKVVDVYMTGFNRIRATIWFKNIPSNTLLFWHSDHKFSLGEKKGRHFEPKTMADFISIMQSYGHELELNLDNNPMSDYRGNGQKPIDLRYML
jgi:hypothetical protein